MLDCEDDVPPVALQSARCDAMKKVLGGCTDPSTGKALKVKRVCASFEPDHRGLIEVLYLTPDGEALTAYLRGRELAYIAEGW